jgi:hypothetical protein
MNPVFWGWSFQIAQIAMFEELIPNVYFVGSF